MSFAAKMIQEGKYAEAIEEATRAVARDEEDPAPLVERARPTPCWSDIPRR